MKTLIIDVDETIVSLRKKWNKWSEDNLGYSLDFTKEINDDRALEFWKRDSLYDNLEPIPEALNTIKKISKDYNIIFCSHCFDEHVESKKKFIQKYFDDIEYRFINTGDKHNVEGDIIIDDRERFLTSDEHITILLKTEFNSTGIADYEMNWKEIEKFLEKEV